MSPEGAADENAREWDGWASERRVGVDRVVGSALKDIPVLADPAGLEAEDVHPGQSQKSRAVWMLIQRSWSQGPNMQIRPGGLYKTSQNSRRNPIMDAGGARSAVSNVSPIATEGCRSIGLERSGLQTTA